MSTDERAVREAHAAWINAVNAGDLSALLRSMTDDVVFMGPGRAPLGREGFPANFTGGHSRFELRCVSELEDVIMRGCQADEYVTA